MQQRKTSKRQFLLAKTDIDVALGYISSSSSKNKYSDG